MTTTTPNMGLTLWNDTTDISVLFKDFRLTLTGPVTSNMVTIDTYCGTLSTLVNNTKGSFYLAGMGTNNYTATNTYITAYFSGLSIILYVDNSNTGASDLTINALGAKNLMKINSSGSVVALSAGDLILNTKYLFVYDGTQFILVGGVSADQIASLIHSATGKTTPVDADEIGISDSEASYGLKKLTWSNLKATLKTYFDTFYVWATVTHAATSKITPVDNDELSIVDTEASNVIKKLLWSNVKATLKTYFDTLYAVAAKGVTNGDSHDHVGGDGAAITESAITLVDNTTNDVSTSKHGFIPKAPADSQKILGGLAGLWVTNDGWIAADETWTYASATSPLFTFTISGDKTGKYQAGQKIKLTQTTAKYFIIVTVAYSAPNTVITIYGGTDYTLANATITSPYFSMTKVPFGFPLSPDKWSLITSNTTTYTKTSPTANTWYGQTNAMDGATTLPTIAIPIGMWNVSYKGLFRVASATPDTFGNIRSTLSTSTSTESDSDFTISNTIAGASGSIVLLPAVVSFTKILTLTSTTTYYLLELTGNGSAASIRVVGATGSTVLKAVCAYL